MSTKKTPASIRMQLFALASASALLVVLLAACGGTDSSATSVSTTSSTTNTNTTSASCDKMITVTFTEKKAAGQDDQYFFNPNVATIKSGEYISFANQTDERHTLITTPDANLTDSVIDENEMQPVQFNQAGTFTVESQNAAHRGSMKVTVSSGTGQTCGIKAPVGTLTFAEKKTAGQPDQYSFSPTTETLKVGDSITLTNNSDEVHTFICTPDAGLDGGNVQLDPNEQQRIQFPQAGTYQCSSKEHPTATVTITVK
jgi:plastocyanin